MERSNLGFVWVCTQIVGSVVLCEFAQQYFNSCFHFYERGLLSCDTQIVCVYEPTCSVVERLVVSVHVEKDGGQDTSLWQAILLFSPSATLIVKLQMLLLFAMIRSVGKSFKVPDVEIVAARMSNESALTRMTDSTPKNLGQT